MRTSGKKKNAESRSKSNTSSEPEESKHSGARSQFKICKFLRPQVRTKFQAQAATIGFDNNERARVEAMNQYFKQYWLSMIHFYKTRNVRCAKLENQLLSAPPQDRDTMRQKFYLNESMILRGRRERMSTRDFMLLAVIGRGGFGEVYLARKSDTGEILALKKMPKKNFLHQNDLSKLKRERDVMMQSSNSPWLIDLKYSFQSENFIYLAMEFVPGGDMKNLLDHVGCFSEVNSRFYFAEMLLAVQALHEIGYIHRDLKPDNFLVTRSGHLKLIDFGLSKDGLVQKYGNALTLKIATAKKNGRPSTSSNPTPTSSRGSANTSSLTNDSSKLNSRKLKQDRRGEMKKAYSVVGSPEYMAIEILEEVGYNHTVDYWSLGIILYELFYGVTPFTSDNSDETFAKLTFWKDYIIPPEPMEDEEEISQYGWDLVSRLICEPEKRVGASSVDEIKQHPWFLYPINNKRKISNNNTNKATTNGPVSNDHTGISSTSTTTVPLSSGNTPNSSPGSCSGIPNSEPQDPFDWEHILQFEPPFIPQLDHELDTSYFSNALDEEDLAVLSQTAAGEILNAEDPSAVSISLEAIDSPFKEQPQEAQTNQQDQKQDNNTNNKKAQKPTYFKNDFEHMAFAGWTFKHDGIAALLEQVDNTDQTKNNHENTHKDTSS